MRTHLGGGVNEFIFSRLLFLNLILVFFQLNTSLSEDKMDEEYEYRLIIDVDYTYDTYNSKEEAIKDLPTFILMKVALDGCEDNKYTIDEEEIGSYQYQKLQEENEKLKEENKKLKEQVEFHKEHHDYYYCKYEELGTMIEDAKDKQAIINKLQEENEELKKDIEFLKL